VLTYHNNSSLTAANLTETQLTPDNVNSDSFGKLRSLQVDGQIYAQPLYVPGLRFNKHGRIVKRNMAYIATQNDTVYAYDADRGSLIWHIAAYNKKMGDKPVPAEDTGSDDITPQIGITSTPVIDKSTNTIYVVAKIKRGDGDSAVYAQRLWAFDLSTGAKKFGGQTILRATVSGDGNAAVNGKISFDPLIENQRSALVLSNGVVYIAFASHGDMGPYHGWLLGYSASNVTQQVAVWNNTPAGSAGGIWQSGAGPSVDSDGNLFLVTGNGTFSSNTGGADFGESIVRIPQTGGSLAPADSFTPFNHDDLDARDFDLGSTGALLLPDVGGDHPHEALFGSKEGKLYLVDRDNLGGFDPNADNVVQIVGPGGQVNDPNARDGIFMTPSYFNGQVFFSSVNGTLAALNVEADGTLSDSGNATTQTFPYPGANPSISANGSNNGIVWVLTKRDDGRAVLQAYNASTLGDPIYTSEDAGDRDVPGGNYVKFTSPTIADGKAMIGTGNEFDVYGLLG
jgi:hypothetical protein